MRYESNFLFFIIWVNKKMIPETRYRDTTQIAMFRYSLLSYIEDKLLFDSTTFEIICL